MSDKSEFIVNGILAFLQQKLLREDQMDTVTAVQICSSRFSGDDICAAKKLLFQSLGIVGTFVPHQRGDEAGKKTLEDIVEVLRENERDMPEFVATEASRLPSNITDHVDVSCLLKEIVALKAGMAEILRKFDESQAVIAVLRKEIISLRDSAPETRSAASNFKNNDRAPCVAAVKTHVADTAHSATRADPRPPCPFIAGPPLPASSKPRRRFADVVVTGEPIAARRKVVPQPQAAREVRVTPKGKPTGTDVNKEGFTAMSRKRNQRKSQCGTAEPVGCGLNVAMPSKALYVSRLHYSATADDVVEDVRQETGYSLRVFQLRSRHYVHISSFVVRVPRPLQGTIACAEFWPKGEVFRQFRWNLPNPIPEMTTQRGHVVSSPK